MQDSVRLSSQRVHTGRVLNLDIDTVKYPDGSVGELEIIRHPGASAVVPLLDDPTASNPRVILIHQYRYAADGFVYEVPAGRLDQGESPETCAVRELEEETGYRADFMTPLTSILTTPGFTDERIHLFMAWGLTPGRPRHERDEFLTTEVLALDEIVEMIQRGAIPDAKSSLAILHVALFARAR